MATSSVRTFLIADIRGYSRYTEECGDEAAAALSRKFSRIVEDESQEFDIMVTAREGGSDHVGLTRWWNPNHHVIGKAG